MLVFGPRGIAPPSALAPAAASVAAQALPADPSLATVRIGITRNGIVEPTSLTLETYVSRVLAGEALPGSPPGAMQALAIAIRTYTIANLNRHRTAGFDLCDTTHCQVMRNATDVTESAAQATAGRILLYGGKPALIYYSASCGGRTELPSEVWPGSVDVPYLPSRPDDGCGGAPAWSSELALSDLSRSFAAAGFRGTLRGLSIASRNGSGRVAKLRLDGLTPAEISGQDLRAAVGATLGWQHIRSTIFEMRRTGNAYHFQGRGSGHGVGMCVIGSARLAERGEQAEAILGRYYPGTTIGSVSGRVPDSESSLNARPPVVGAADTSAGRPAQEATAAGAGASPAVPAGTSSANGVLLFLPDADAGESTAIRDLVVKARDELARTLAVAAPPRITLRFHPTNNDYEKATGQEWFTFGTMAGADLHFVPVTTLRNRGLLERTVRRQLVHVLVDESLRRRPAWVREGASLFYSDPDGNASIASRAPCPTDLELTRPVTAGALAGALTDARSCFARQVASGRKWSDVR
jgi:SpoIID/LytB domain protein